VKNNKFIKCKKWLKFTSWFNNYNIIIWIYNKIPPKLYNKIPPKLYNKIPPKLYNIIKSTLN